MTIYSSLAKTRPATAARVQQEEEKSEELEKQQQ